jgi:hypothetical protein
MTETEKQQPKRQFEVVAVRKLTKFSDDDEDWCLVDVQEQTTKIILTGIRVGWDSENDRGAMVLPRHEVQQGGVPVSIPTFSYEGPPIYKQIVESLSDFSSMIDDVAALLYDDDDLTKNDGDDRSSKERGSCTAITQKTKKKN